MPTGGYQYGCKRRPDAPLGEQLGPVAFVPDTSDLTPETPVMWASGPPRPLRPGEAVYAALSLELWRLETDGSFTRLRGAAGQRVSIDSVGPWSAENGAIRPLMAVADGAKWRVDTSQMTPVNANPSLRPRGGSRLPDGWTVPDNPQVTVTHRQEGDGWLELRAVAPGAEFSVRTAMSLGSQAGGPVTAVLSVRAIGAGTIQARIVRSGSGGPPAPSDNLVVSQVPDGDWQTLVLRLPPSDAPADSLELSVSVDAPRPGDRLDIRTAAIYSGRYP